MSAIKVGDLVVVVQEAECGCAGSHGTLVVSAEHPYFGAWPTRLKRIPPLDELEGEKRDAEITA